VYLFFVSFSSIEFCFKLRFLCDVMWCCLWYCKWIAISFVCLFRKSVCNLLYLLVRAKKLPVEDQDHH